MQILCSCNRNGGMDSLPDTVQVLHHAWFSVPQTEWEETIVGRLGPITIQTKDGKLPTFEEIMNIADSVARSIVADLNVKEPFSVVIDYELNDGRIVFSAFDHKGNELYGCADTDGNVIAYPKYDDYDENDE